MTGGGGGDQFQVFGELLKAVVERATNRVEILARSLADCDLRQVAPLLSTLVFELLLLRGLNDTLSVQSLLHGLKCNRCTINVVSDSHPSPSLLFWFFGCTEQLVVSWFPEWWLSPEPQR